MHDTLQVAVNKPSGLQVLPAGAFHHCCALTILRQHFLGASPQHRLGRGTSGQFLRCAAAEMRAEWTREVWGWCIELLSWITKASLSAANILLLTFSGC